MCSPASQPVMLVSTSAATLNSDQVATAGAPLQQAVMALGSCLTMEPKTITTHPEVDMLATCPD
jgi:hypothetical protein